MPGLYVAASSKQNLARKPLSLSYRLIEARVEGYSSAVRVDWCGAVDIAADDLASNEPLKGEQVSQFGATVEYLEETLAGGSLPASDIYEKGRAAGFSRSMIHRASKTLEIQKVRAGYPAHTIWRLPQSLQSLHVIDELTETTDHKEAVS